MLKKKYPYLRNEGRKGKAMLKIKRYVVEFSNDMINRLESSRSALNNDVVNYRINRISQYVTACKCGLITDYETIKAIIDVMETTTIPGSENYD